jgi:hypothetical protein
LVTRDVQDGLQLRDGIVGDPATVVQHRSSVLDRARQFDRMWWLDRMW